MDEKMSIMVVDDELIIRESFLHWFEKLGHMVEAAASGFEALEKLERYPFELLFVDVKMPGMDGIELLGKVKQEYPDTIIIIITAYGSIDTAVNAMKMGAADYLLKPFKPDQLSLVLEKVANQRRLVSEYKYLKGRLDQITRFDLVCLVWLNMPKKHLMLTFIEPTVIGTASFHDAPFVGACLTSFGLRTAALLETGDHMADSNRLPVRRNQAQPLDAGVLHLHVGVEALGDGVADEGGALLLEQFDLTLLLLDERVDPPRLAVEECRYGTLFVNGGQRDSQIAKLLSCEMGNGGSVTENVKPSSTTHGVKHVHKETHISGIPRPFPMQRVLNDAVLGWRGYDTSPPDLSTFTYEEIAALHSILPDLLLARPHLG